MKRLMTLALALLTGAAVCVTMVSCDDDDVTPSGGGTHEYVDLGLPSGTLWATCNVGASSPEGYGDYFAWGEIKGYNGGKTTFDWGTYKWCEGESFWLTKYCYNSGYGFEGFTDDPALTELVAGDDAATAKWGSKWRMPTIGQFEELINSSYTTTIWTKQNGVIGRRITSKSNGNSIFLPAAGFRDGGSLSSVGSYGFYWSRTLHTGAPDRAYGLDFSLNNIRKNYGSRCWGLSVRAVYVE